MWKVCIIHTQATVHRYKKQLQGTVDSNFDLCTKFSKELLDSQASVVTTKEKDKKKKFKKISHSLPMPRF